MRAALLAAQPEIADDELTALIEAGAGSPGRALRFAGLDVRGLDRAIATIAGDGDPGNAQRSALGRALTGKGVTARYEAFLERVPAFVAARARRQNGPALAATLAIHAQAREAAGAALGLSLDPQATVWQMAGLLAALPR